MDPGAGRVTAYVGLGSNQSDPVGQVCAALRALDALPDCRRVGQSSLYRNPPMGPQDQPDFINAVAALDVALPAGELLAAVQRIEQAHGRERGPRWGPRVLDLDLLLYGEATIRSAGLTVPHPGVHQRAFVLYPLAELDRSIPVPGHGPVGALLAGCPDPGPEVVPGVEFERGA